MSRATMDDIESDLGHLNELIGVMANSIMELDFGGAQNSKLQRLNAMIWIGRDISTKLVADLEAISPADRGRHG